MLKSHLWSIAVLTLIIQISPGATAQSTETKPKQEIDLDEQQPVTPFVNTSAKLPAHFPVPGGIAIVPLNMRTSRKPVVRFGSREVLVVPHQNQWQAIVGLPIDILPGNYILGTLNAEDETGKVPMRVITLPPPVQNPSDNKKSADSPTHANRRASPIELDAALLSSDYINSAMIVPGELLTESRNLVPSFAFAPVVESEQVIPYGKILRKNKIVVHNYLSFIGRTDAQVYAPAPGVVVRVVEDQKRGGTLYISHGGGIISVLGNLDKILVQEGQALDRGEQIGRADFDGSLDQSRVDYGMGLNGFLIDPLQFPSSP